MSSGARADQPLAQRLAMVDPDRLRADLHYLAKDPLPYRAAGFTLPGHAKSTLAEAEDFLAARLTSLGYAVDWEPVRVQAYRCDMSKPKSTWYSRPLPDDPWYTAHNLSVERPGRSRPKEIIVICAHKDSQSWWPSPGAYDNGVGTVAVLEMARILAGLEPERTIRLLWCNEEHSPWTSVTAAMNAKQRGDDLVAIFNTDSLAGRSLADHEAGRRTNVTRYTVDSARPLAELHSDVNEAFGIGLEQTIVKREAPGDDDGSFVKAGYPNAVMNLGSCPYAHDWYHDERDVPEAVDYVNLTMSTKLVLGTVLRVDRDGVPS